MLNLIDDPWIPCIQSDGARVTCAPWQIFAHGGNNNHLSLSTPRPDFQGAIFQFLIGLVQTTMAPKNEDQWVEGLQDLPDEQVVKQRFETVSSAFNLGGAGPRFMQDTNCNDGKQQSIDTLLIGMPGENTLKLNGDFFQKRKSVQKLCPTCSAVALMTLQLNGPPGGVGHRTGLRGGGPLTSVILGTTLPETIWLNILPADEFFIGFSGSRLGEIQDIFPWMGPLRTSEGGVTGQTTGISDASQLQMYWGMGRRILLDSSHPTKGTCDLCGEETKQGITSLKTKTYGIRYDETWRHVLTPYYQSEGMHLPVHLQHDGITYKHWLGLVQNDEEVGREVARVVHRFRLIQRNLSEILPVWPRLWAFGYDLENVKARCWYDSTMPLIRVDDSIRGDYEIYTAQIVRAAHYVNEVVHGSVKDALYKSEKEGEISGGKERREKIPKNLPIVKSRFWSETEALFYGTLSDIKNALEKGEPVGSVKRQWVMGVKKVGLDLFDFYSQAAYVDAHRTNTIVAARKRLSMTISPGSPNLMKILSLSKET